MASSAHADEHGRAALAALCASYWQPLYAWLRRQGHAPQDAEDLVQGLFTELIDHQAFSRANALRGRFRSFLLGALKNHVGRVREAATAQKRGGGRKLVTLPWQDFESQTSFEPADPETVDRSFARDWARSVLSAAIERVRVEYAESGKFALFDRLRPFLTRDGLADRQARAAQDLQMSDGAVAVALHRLRSRLREALRREVGDTVSSAAEVDEEIDDLFRALGRTAADGP